MILSVMFRTIRKTLGIDVEKGKMTLPMIHFRANAPHEHQMLLRSLLESHESDKVERIRNLILPSDSIAYARGKAASLIRDARRDRFPSRFRCTQGTGFHGGFCGIAPDEGASRASIQADHHRRQVRGSSASRSFHRFCSTVLNRSFSPATILGRRGTFGTFTGMPNQLANGSGNSTAGWIGERGWPHSRLPKNALNKRVILESRE